MKFEMFSDLNYDAIPDGNRRIEDFLTSAKKLDSEFWYEYENNIESLNIDR